MANVIIPNFTPTNDPETDYNFNMLYQVIMGLINEIDELNNNKADKT